MPGHETKNKFSQHAYKKNVTKRFKPIFVPIVIRSVPSYLLRLHYAKRFTICHVSHLCGYKSTRSFAGISNAHVHGLCVCNVCGCVVSRRVYAFGPYFNVCMVEYLQHPKRCSQSDGNFAGLRRERQQQQQHPPPNNMGHNHNNQNMIEKFLLY